VTAEKGQLDLDNLVEAERSGGPIPECVLADVGHPELLGEAIGGSDRGSFVKSMTTDRVRRPRAPRVADDGWGNSDGDAEKEKGQANGEVRSPLG
jgi:hypothetical protein